jgi:hypothetical protein
MILMGSVAFRMLISEVQSNAVHQLSFFLLLITNNIAIFTALPSLLTYFVSKYWDSSVGIATGYGLDGQGSISFRGKDIFLFSTTSRQTLGSPSLPYNMVPGDFSRQVKRLKREADYFSPPSAEVNNGGLYCHFTTRIDGMVLI